MVFSNFSKTRCLAYINYLLSILNIIWIRFFLFFFLFDSYIYIFFNNDRTILDVPINFLRTFVSVYVPTNVQIFRIRNFFRTFLIVRKKLMWMFKIAHEQLNFLGMGTGRIPETTEIFGCPTDNISDNRFFKTLNFIFIIFHINH